MLSLRVLHKRMIQSNLRVSALAIRADSFLPCCLRDWSKKKVTPLATSLTSPDGVICSEPQAIAAEISRHWSGVFGVPHLMDKDAADIYILSSTTPQQ
eukprot:1500009-Amphidinium_carterae.1